MKRGILVKEPDGWYVSWYDIRRGKDTFILRKLTPLHPTSIDPLFTLDDDGSGCNFELVKEEKVYAKLLPKKTPVTQ